MGRGIYGKRDIGEVGRRRIGTIGERDIWEDIALCWCHVYKYQTLKHTPRNKKVGMFHNVSYDLEKHAG